MRFCCLQICIETQVEKLQTVLKMTTTVPKNKKSNPLRKYSLLLDLEIQSKKLGGKPRLQKSVLSVKKGTQTCCNWFVY